MATVSKPTKNNAFKLYKWLQGNVRGEAKEKDERMKYVRPARAKTNTKTPK